MWCRGANCDQRLRDTLQQWLLKTMHTNEESLSGFINRRLLREYSWVEFLKISFLFVLLLLGIYIVENVSLIGFVWICNIYQVTTVWRAQNTLNAFFFKSLMFTFRVILYRLISDLHEIFSKRVVVAWTTVFEKCLFFYISFTFIRLVQLIWG